MEHGNRFRKWWILTEARSHFYFNELPPALLPSIHTHNTGTPILREEINILVFSPSVTSPRLFFFYYHTPHTYWNTPSQRLETDGSRCSGSRRKKNSSLTQRQKRRNVFRFSSLDAHYTRELYGEPNANVINFKCEIKWFHFRPPHPHSIRPLA